MEGSNLRPRDAKIDKWEKKLRTAIIHYEPILKEIEDNDNEKSYIKDYLNYKSIFRLEVRTKHNLLVDTLNKIGYTDIYLFQCILNREFDELYFIYDELLRRLIRIEYNNKVYSLIDFI